MQFDCQRVYWSIRVRVMTLLTKVSTEGTGERSCKKSWIAQSWVAQGKPFDDKSKRHTQFQLRDNVSKWRSFFFLSQRSTSDVGEQSLSSGACLSNCYFCSAELLVFPHELLPSIEVLTRNISFKKCTAILKHRILTLQVKTCSYFKEHELSHFKKKLKYRHLI